jgi:CAAX amino terminal protease family.
MDNWGMDEENPKKILSKAWFGLFLLAAIFIASQAGISVLVDRFYPKLAKTDWYSWGLTALTLIVIGLPVYLLFMRTIPNSPKGEVVKLKIGKFVVFFFICAAAMYLTNIFSSVITVLIAFLKGDKQLLNPAQEAIMNSNYYISLLYAAIIAPIIEELIFRKVLLDKFRRFGDIPAILMTGIAFGLFHMNLTQFFYAAVLGFLFAYITIQTNTVKYAIILHMLVNTISTSVAPFVLRGNIILGLVLTMWVMVAIITGGILFAFNIKKIRFEKITPIVQRKDYIMNAGAICYASICIIMIGIITIFN